MHFVRQCFAVHPAKSPKHPAQPLLQPLPAMHELTHEPLPKHFVPQDVMSDCHWECPASPFHFVVSASVQELVVWIARLGASKPVHEPAPNAAVSHPAALRQVTQSGVRPLMHFVRQCCAVHPPNLQSTLHNRCSSLYPPCT